MHSARHVAAATHARTPTGTLIRPTLARIIAGPQARPEVSMVAVPYHVEPAWRGDSVAGVRASIRKGAVGQDINGQCLKDLRFAAGHWGDADRNGIVSKAKMAALTAARWLGLRGKIKPALLTDILRDIGRSGLNVGDRFVPCFEIKPGPGTHKRAPYAELQQVADAEGVHMVVMTIQRYPVTGKAGDTWEASAIKRMQAAKAAGVRSRMVLWRKPIPANSPWWDVLTAVKGAPASQKVPAHVVKIPSSAPSQARAREYLLSVASTPPASDPDQEDDMAIIKPDIIPALRAAGLKVSERPGWQSRGHGPFASFDTIACHHTAGPASGDMPSLGVVTSGRVGLAGPLCNFGLGRDGTVHVVAAGIAYHAGAVLNTTYDNRHAIGIEAEATGTSAWPEVQMDAYARLCKVLCEHYDIPTSRVLGHKEICSPRGRKIDPNFDMSAFRNRVARVSTKEEFTMDAEAKTAFAEVKKMLADDAREAQVASVNRHLRATIAGLQALDNPAVTAAIAASYAASDAKASGQ